MVDLLVYQVKEVDDYLERRRRLGTKKPFAKAETDEEDDRRGAKAKSKAAAKAAAHDAGSQHNPERRGAPPLQPIR